MKRIVALSLSVLILVFLSVVDVTEAQQQKARRITRTNDIEVEEDASSCPTTIADCPDKGCGEGADFLLNTQKNRKDVPNDSAVQSLTLDDIRNIAQPRSWPTNKERSSIQTPGKEGTPVVVKGFLLKAKKEGAESCNCGITGVQNTDIHLVLVNHPNDIEAISVTAEMTPRFRKNGHPQWLQSQVKQFEGEYIRVTGWLTLDTKHLRPNRPLVRSTNWEVHPITKFEVCTKTKRACDRNDGWEQPLN